VSGGGEISKHFSFVTFGLFGAWHVLVQCCAMVAAVAATPGCSQAHNLGHSKECLPAQHNFAAQHNFVAYDRHSVAQHNFMVQCNLVTQHKFRTQHKFEAKYNFI